MHIWVDADACPRPVKEVLFRAAQRVQVPCTLVANQPVAVPRSALIRAIQVRQGFDVADNEIVRRCEPGDLVVTQDIPCLLYTSPSLRDAHEFGMPSSA